MATISLIRVPVETDGKIVDLVDLAHARRLVRASNASGVYAAFGPFECSRCNAKSAPAGKKFRCPACGYNRHTARPKELVRILISPAGDDSNVKALSGDPRKYTFLFRTDDMPQGCHTLKHLPRSTEALYCTVRSECMKQAA